MLPPKPTPNPVTGKNPRDNTPEILDEHELIRGIPERHKHPTEDGGFRVSSALFEPDHRNNEGLSCNLKNCLEADGIDPELFTLNGSDFVGTVIFTAGDIRKTDATVAYDPIPENAYHAQCWGKFPQTKRRRIASICNVKFT